LAITSNAANIGVKCGPSQLRWEKPNVRQTKVNVDGSFHQDLHAGAAGVVLRDHEDNCGILYFSPKHCFGSGSRSYGHERGIGSC
jgi:hypothetical protein